MLFDIKPTEIEESIEAGFRTHILHMAFQMGVKLAEDEFKEAETLFSRFSIKIGELNENGNSNRH